MSLLASVSSDQLIYFGVISLAMFLFGVSKGGFGGSLGIMSVFLINLILPFGQAIAIILPILCLMDLVAIFIYRKRNWSTPNLVLLLPAAMVGIFCGYLLLDYLPETLLKLILGSISILFALDGMVKKMDGTPDAIPSKSKGLFWGSLAGLTSMIAHAGGPPTNIYLLPQKLSKEIYVGTTAYLFFAINLAKVYPYYQLGLFDQQLLMHALIIAPFASLGVLAGYWLQKIVNKTIFYAICYWGLLLTGVKLLFDASISVIAG